MYSRCLFCAADLGRNDVVEHFPVGRRLAFDAAKGRLWVVCRRCLRWNLTPLEERWEAIEEAERLFRDTPLRTSTSNIGLAKVREGLELVRIGKPERPEFAAWRYGETFLRRRTRVIVATVGVVAVGGVALATGAIGLLKAAVPGGGLLYQLPNWYNIYRMTHAPVARVTDDSGRRRVIRGRHLGTAAILPGDGGPWQLRVGHGGGVAWLTGHRALDVAGRILARFNRRGGGRGDVQSAVGQLDASGGSEGFLERVAHESPRRDPRQRRRAGMLAIKPAPDSIALLPQVDRLALEMAVHEETERRALEGELEALEARWKEAEEIAAIADDLTLPGTVTRALARLRGDREDPQG
jgi:hypothetical protein